MIVVIIYAELLLKKDVQKGKLSEEERQAALERIEVTTALKDFGGCDFVIEAVAENPVLKRELFASLDALVSPDTVHIHHFYYH